MAELCRIATVHHPGEVGLVYYDPSDCSYWQMKPRKKPTESQRETFKLKFLSLVGGFLVKHPHWTLKRFHSGHYRLIDGKRLTDFWPVTGTWYDLDSRAKGKGFDSLERFLTGEQPEGIPRSKYPKPEDPKHYDHPDLMDDIPSFEDLNPETPPW
jgi:hypothetical protein